MNAYLLKETKPEKQKKREVDNTRLVTVEMRKTKEKMCMQLNQLRSSLTQSGVHVHTQLHCYCAREAHNTSCSLPSLKTRTHNDRFNVGYLTETVNSTDETLMWQTNSYQCSQSSRQQTPLLLRNRRATLKHV